MKKLLSLLLVVFLLLSVAACAPSVEDGTEKPSDSVEVTEAPTEAPTEPPTEAPTEPPTEAPTEALTEAVTEPATEAPTETPTEAPTESRTGPATEAPTETSFEAPTEPPTEPPTEALTEPPTEAPSESPEEEPETYEVRLYSVMPEPNVLMQSFILRTEHGKLIVIDGGLDVIPTPNADAYMPALLRAIAGVGEDGHVEVEAWIISHAHKDHMNELTRTLEQFASDENFVINNFYFDIPEFGGQQFPYTNSDSLYLDAMKKALNNYATVRNIPISVGSTYYDDLNGAYANANSIANGCELIIDGVRIEFLQTWNRFDGNNINDTSLVLRMYVENQSILFLQDAGTAAGKRLVRTYGDYLKSDIVQMAHHGQGGVREDVYEIIDANVRIWPTPLFVWNYPAKYEIDENRRWVHDGEDFKESSEWDIVTCLYSAYPTDRTSVSAWLEVIEEMSIPLPYASVYTEWDY